MARRTTNINLEVTSPDKFLTLCKDISEYNTSLGASSPLADGDIVDMGDFTALAMQAAAARKKALEHYAIAEAAMYESRRLMGTIKGQTVNTPGTLFYLATKIKKLLLVLNSENPEALSMWGFNVVVRVAKNPGRRKKAPVS